ncbi:MAG: type II secretion system protein [bacterium]|nr:type II secretion system protein [bacterium]
MMKRCIFVFKKSAFTLAEVLITLAIIGVVAAVSIPSVISNSQQQEFKTGLKKAVSVLNSSITMNMALDGESPYENIDTFNYLQRHMSVMKSTTALPYRYRTKFADGGNIGGSMDTNAAFYTTDGMRFEVDNYSAQGGSGPKLHESEQRTCKLGLSHPGHATREGCGGCGSLGLNHNPNNTTKPPCVILVDVNGDRKPSPSNVDCNDSVCEQSSFYVIPKSDSKRVTDLFLIMITDEKAAPFGVIAQKAMYNSRN